MANATQFDPRPIAKAIAARLHAPRSVERKDLIQAGLLGYCECLARFDGSRAALSTYARHRIRGAMLDYLRHIDPLSRNHRRAVKVGAADDVETVHLEAALPVADRQQFVGQSLARVDAERLLAALKPRSQRIVRMHYFGDLRMREISERVGLSEARVSQIIAAALRKMRAAAGRN